MYALQKPSRGKNITLARLCLIEYTRNVCAVLDYVHTTTYNWINESLPCVPIVQFYILIWFNIRRNFCTRMSIRLTYSVHPVNCAINSAWNKPVTTYTTKHQHASHTIKHFSIIIRFNIRRHFLWQHITCAVGCDILPSKESIIYTLLSLSWKLYWIFSSTIKHSNAHPQPLHIVSRNCTYCLLFIYTLFASITKLTNMGGC